MLHLLYILAFTIIASIALSNLIRSLISLSSDSQRVYPNYQYSSERDRSSSKKTTNVRTIHPELLDERGKVIEEPLLVMRSVSVEDARQKLDALYNSSPNKTSEFEE